MKKMKSWLATILSVAMVFSFTVAPGISAVAAEVDKTEDAEIEMYAEITEEENSDVIASEETTDFEDEIGEAGDSAVEDETMADAEVVDEEETASETEAEDEENTEAETEAGEEDNEAEDITVEADEDGIMLLSETEGEDEDGIMPLATTTVNYVDENGTSHSQSATIVTASDTSWSGWYVVDSNITNSNRITVSGTVNLILVDGCTLTVSSGIEVDSGNTLNIYGQSGGTGAIIATGEINYAAIGGGYYQSSSGSITINGGMITANGGYYASGIGGGIRGEADVTINGGTVIASSQRSGAGIGGGSDGAGGSITINGGKITASGGSSAAGIGGGSSGNGGTIKINGGEITASGSSAAGIGGGSSGNGGTITISGGTVIASSQDGGAGIGGGYNGSGGTITISGGTVEANGAENGAGIGGGYQGSSGTIKISGGMITANGGNWAAGIGGGIRGGADNITISGGTVIASGRNGGAGIGRGVNGSEDGTITIGNCVIYASSIMGFDASNCSGIISESNVNGTATVYGSPVFSSDVCIPNGKTAWIENGKTVTIASGATLTNYGTLYQDWGSTFTKTGTYADSGTTYYQVKNSLTGFGQDISLSGVSTYSGNTYATESMTVSLPSGYQYSDLTVTKNSSGTVNTSDGSFTMPNEPVNLSGLAQKEITEDMFPVNTDPETYTGSEITKAISGSDGGSSLTEDTDYTVAYTDNIDAGTATITIEATGDYTGTLNYTFTINQAEITKDMFSVDTTSETYSGEKFEKDISGKYGDLDMTEDTDYTVEYADNTNAGTATITITGEGNYTGTLTYEFDIAKADQDISYENTELHHLENAHSFTNELTVTTQSTDEDSRITYSSSDEDIAFVDPDTGEVNIDGTGTVTITATAAETDNFNEATASYTLEIVQPEETVSDDVEKVYDGGDIYLYAEVEHDEELGDAEGLTYTYYWYRNDELFATTSTNVLRLSAADVNVQDGTEFTCAIEMVDPYLDEYIHQYQTITITITAKEITEVMFEVNTEEETYTGSEITKAIIGSDPELGVSLNADVDYTVRYEDNTDAGTATIIITGIGNYGGELPYIFVINKAVYDMSGIGFADATYTYNGEAQAVEITGDLPDGVTVSYTDNTRVNVGSQTATATFTGDADNYEEIPDMTAELTILEATFGDMAVTATGYSGTYDGEGHTITVELSGNAEGAEVTYSTDEEGEYSDENPAFTDVGTYTVYYKVSKENYEDVTGSLTVEITERTLTTDMFDVDTNEKTYTGEPITTLIDSALVEGIDYTVSYEDNTDVGTAVITITGIGNYTGTLTYTFKIVEEEKGHDGSGGGSGGTGNTGANGGETTGSGITGANTADTNAPILYGILIALAGAAIVTLGVRRRVIRR